MTPAATASLAGDTPSQRWPARLALELEARPGKTVLARKHQLGPLSVQRPFYPEGEAAHVYLLHPPGGVAGGDDLDIGVGVGEAAHALITTPGATKFYRSAGATATQAQNLRVTKGATLEWFPQENIFFPGAQVRAATSIHLDPGARLAAWEIHCLGRPANAERFDQGLLELGLRLTRDQKPLLNERLRISETRGLDGASGLRGFPVTGTLMLSGCGPELVSQAREALPRPSKELLSGLTLLDDMLLARALSHNTESVRRLFISIWRLWRPEVISRPPCEPRIWAT